MTLKPDGGFRSDNVGRKHNHALQPLADRERLCGNAIESFTTQVLRSALNRLRSRLPGQAYRPMEGYPLVLAAIRRIHGANRELTDVGPVALQLDQAAPATRRGTVARYRAAALHISIPLQ